MKLKELLDMQEKLDNKVIEVHKLEDKPSEELQEERLLALMVEIGELSNEIECFKYWKKNKRSNKEKQLEELADCLHFTLSLMNMNGAKYKDMELSEVRADFIQGESLTLKILSINNALFEEDYGVVFCGLIQLGRDLGFTTEEIEQAYVKKNKENYNRLENNY